MHTPSTSYLGKKPLGMEVLILCGVVSQRKMLPCPDFLVVVRLAVRPVVKEELHSMPSGLHGVDKIDANRVVVAGTQQTDALVVAKRDVGSHVDKPGAQHVEGRDVGLSARHGARGSGIVWSCGRRAHRARTGCARYR